MHLPKNLALFVFGDIILLALEFAQDLKHAWCESKVTSEGNSNTLMIQVHVDLLGLILKYRPAENLLTGEHWLQQHIQKSTRNTYLFPPRMFLHHV
jgi:hypothetical protein